MLHYLVSFLLSVHLRPYLFGQESGEFPRLFHRIRNLASTPSSGIDTGFQRPHRALSRREEGVLRNAIRGQTLDYRLGDRRGNSGSLLFFQIFPQSAAPPAPQANSARIGGKPDFSGIWQANNTGNWDIQTHAARPMVAQPGLTPNSVVLAAPVVGLGAIGWVPGCLGVVEGNEIPYLPWAAAEKGGEPGALDGPRS